MLENNRQHYAKEFECTTQLLFQILKKIITREIYNQRSIYKPIFDNITLYRVYKYTLASKGMTGSD